MKRLKLSIVAALAAIGETLYLALTAHMGRAGLILYDMDPKDIKAALDKISDQVREAGEKALAEAKKYGDMYAADKPKVDEMLVKQGELQARLLEVEQKAARRGNEEDTRILSAGEKVVESEEFKAFVASGGMRMANSACVVKLPRADITGTSTTNTTTVGVAPEQVPGVFPGTQRRLTVRDLVAPGTTDSNSIQYIKETGFTNNASTVSETTLKPQSHITYAVTQAAVVTVAHYFKASKQILDDFKQLQSSIDARGRYGLKLVEENQLLKGSGVGHNLNGIYTQATAYAAPITVPTPRRIDVLRLMLLQAELAEYPSDGIVLHPSDWAAIELMKDTTGRYIIGNPQGTLAPSLWARPVVATQAMTVDTALVGAFKMGAQIFDREDVNVVIATQNEDDFIRNMITIRIEERLALACYRPEAFIALADMPGT